jgi:hypothetical protein
MCSGDTKGYISPECPTGASQKKNIETDGKYLYENRKRTGKILWFANIKEKGSSEFTTTIKYKVISRNHYLRGMVKTIKFQSKTNEKLVEFLTKASK